MEIVRILYFSATYFSAIGQSISPYSIRIRENKDQKNSEYCCIKNPIKHMRWSFMWKQPAPIFPLFRNQPVDLLCKSIKWFLYDGNIGREKINYFCQNCYHKCLTGLKCASELYGRPHLTRTLYFSLGQKNFHASLRYLKNV